MVPNKCLFFKRFTGAFFLFFVGFFFKKKNQAKRKLFQALQEQMFKIDNNNNNINNKMAIIKIMSKIKALQLAKCQINKQTNRKEKKIKKKHFKH